jgi:hypothetical protein
MSTPLPPAVADSLLQPIHFEKLSARLAELKHVTPEFLSATLTSAGMPIPPTVLAEIIVGIRHPTVGQLKKLAAQINMSADSLKKGPPIGESEAPATVAPTEPPAPAVSVPRPATDHHAQAVRELRHAASIDPCLAGVAIATELSLAQTLALSEVCRVLAERWPELYLGDEAEREAFYKEAAPLAMKILASAARKGVKLDLVPPRPGS